MPVNALVG